LKSHFEPDEVGKKLTSERSESESDPEAESTRGRSRLLLTVVSK